MNNKGICVLMLMGFMMVSAHAQENFLPLEHNGLTMWITTHGRLAAPSQQPWLSANGPMGEVAVVKNIELFVRALDPGENVFFTSLNGHVFSYPTGAPGAWKVTSDAISAHRADYIDNGFVDNPQASIFGWPARGNDFFVDYFGYDLPDHDNQPLAPFWDENNNGRYEPHLGDFPAMMLAECTQAIIPSQMIWTALECANAPPWFGYPTEVHTTIFTLACEEENPLNQTMFWYSRLINRFPYINPTEWQLGVQVNPDLGCGQDNYVGSIPALNLAYAYKRNNDGVACGAGSGFGRNPPAFGVQWLRTPHSLDLNPVGVTSFMTSYDTNTVGIPTATVIPANPRHMRYRLTSIWNDGSPLTVGGLGYQTGDPTNFAFPGLPRQPGGWTEWEDQNPIGPRQMYLASGFFEQLPDSENEMLVAFTLTPPGAANHLDQVTELVAQSDVVQVYFDNCFAFDAADLPPCTQVLTHTRAVQTPTVALAVQPNPVLHWAELRSAEPLSGQLTLLDLAGRPLAHWTLAQHTTFSLDLHAWPAGVYLLRYQGHNGATGMQRLVVGR